MLPELTYRRDFHRHQPVTAGSASGRNRAYFEESLKLWPEALKLAAINLSECFIDGTFVVAKRGANVGKTKRGKGTKLMVIADASGLPLAVHTDSASPHEVTLVQATLNEIVTVGQPRRIIGDRAYDSDPLDSTLAAQGIEMIAPHRCNRKRKVTQDGRPLLCYRRRWKIERLFAWLNAFKRTMTRWDRFHERFAAFVHLAFSIILLKRVVNEL